jgi:hypothetical protein
MRGVGMTHGETVEMIWSHSTSLATWSHENGPSTRHALLDVHWSGWNWRKLVYLCIYTSLFSFSSFPLILSLFVGRQLKKNLEKAWKFSKIQGNIATTLTKVLDPTLINIWIEEMDAYYLDPLNEPNPFEEHVPSKPHFLHVHVPRVEYRLDVTLDDLKADLARADAVLRESGKSYAHETTPSQFISQALKIEEQQ